MITNDAMQANLGFVVAQTTHVEAGVYALRYPDIQYQALVPVDTSANPWVDSVTYYSMDGRGRADWINGKARDIPLVGTEMGQHNTGVHMAGIGYEYSLEEVMKARLQGIALPSEKAAIAKRAYEEMVDRVALEGDTAKGFSGLYSYPGVTAAAAANGATGASPLWSTKTGDEIVADVNSALAGIHNATNTVAMADTLLIPIERYLSLVGKRVGDTPQTVMSFIAVNNIYTLMTGKPLTIRGVRGLVAKGAGATARMVAYRRDPTVLKLHIPMPHQFLPVQTVIMQYLVPGIFRLGGLDVRLPSEVRYTDGI